MPTNGEISTFSAFCDLIADFAAQSPDFVLLTADEAAAEALKKTAKDKIIASCETPQSAVLRAVGLATVGKRPWVVATAEELAGRCYAQIREAALHSLPLRFVARNGGLSNAHDGAAAHMLEDFALMRTVPALGVFAPSGAATLQYIVEKTANANFPFYMRLGSVPVGLAEDGSRDAFDGGATILRDGSDVTIAACGIMVEQALAAAERLERQNINAEVVDCFRLKPFPDRVLLSSVRRTGCCVTAEEHGEIGGLFSATAECVGRTYPIPIRSVAAGNRFINSGTAEELREYYGLTWKEIVDASAQVWALHRR